MEIKEVMHKDFISLKLDDSISSFIGKIKNKDKRFAFVFENKEFKGVVSKFLILRSRIPSAEMKVRSVIKKVKIINPHTSLAECAKEFFNSGSYVLPVGEYKVEGYASVMDILKNIDIFTELKGKRVKDVRYNKVPKHKLKDTLGSVISDMAYSHNYIVPLFDNKKRLSDVISIRDIFDNYYMHPYKRERAGGRFFLLSTKAFESERKDILSMAIENIVRKKSSILKVDESENIISSVKKMAMYGLLDAVVMKDGKYKGIISPNNIMRYITAILESRNFNIHFSGFKKSGMEMSKINNLKGITSTVAFRLGRMIKNEFKLNVNLKEYNKGGKRRKCSVHINLVYPGKDIASSESDWNPETALRKVLNNIEKEIVKYYRTDAQVRRSYG